MRRTAAPLWALLLAAALRGAPAVAGDPPPPGKAPAGPAAGPAEAPRPRAEPRAKDAHPAPPEALDELLGVPLPTVPTAPSASPRTEPAPDAARAPGKGAAGLASLPESVRLTMDPLVGRLHVFDGGQSTWVCVLVGNPHVSGKDLSVKARSIVVWLDKEKSPDLGGFLGGAEADGAAGTPKTAREAAAGAGAGSRGAGPVATAGASVVPDALVGVYAEGGVELVSGVLRFRASELYVDARRNRALLVEPRFDGQAGTMGRDATPVPLHVRASRARILAAGLASFDDAEASTSRANDRIALRVSTMSIEEYGDAVAGEPLFLGFRGQEAPPGSTASAPWATKRYSAQGIVGQAERVPLFRVGSATFGGDDLEDMPVGVRRLRFGKRSSLGWTGFLGFGGREGSPEPWFDWTVDVGGYTDRGPAGATDLRWRLPSWKSKLRAVEGRLQTFAMHDATGEDRTGYDAGPGFRGMLWLENRWEVAPRWRLDAEANLFSDRGVQREFFEADVRTHKDRESYARARFLDGGAAATLTAGAHWRDFVTESVAQPEAALWSESVPLPRLGAGPSLDLSTEARAGSLVHNFDDAVDDDGYHANRLDLTERVYAPFSLGDVRVSPFVGGRGTAYFDRDDGGDDVVRTAMEAGVRANVQLHRDFGTFGGPWSLDGLRHTVDVDVGGYARFLDPYDPDDVPYFDRIDTEEDRTEVFCELRNRLTTSRGVGDERRNVDLLDARLRVSWWPDEIGPYGRRGPGEAEGWLLWELAPNQVWFAANALGAFEGAALRRATGGVLVAPTEDFAVAVGLRQVHDKALGPWVDAYWRWDPKWAIRVAAYEDLERSGDGSVRLSLLRFSDDHVFQLGVTAKQAGRDLGVFVDVLPAIGGRPTRSPFQARDDVLGAAP
ncbi:MAG: hypothetical protein IT460_00555 [Planctomycetes bacterium]|nr:hypothetical protein [Planctomycetota bacterium]